MVGLGGGRETLTKTTTTYTTIEDRVEELFESLEKIIDHKAHSETSEKGVSVKPRLRTYLEGWDFRDLATSRDPLYLRVTTLPNFGRTWVDFSKSIRAVTLFGCGFGDIIKPASSGMGLYRELSPAWDSMPKGKGFLGACVADLREIAALHGDKNTRPFTLAAGILWHNPGERSPFGVDKGSTSVSPRWNPVQELFPANLIFRRLLQNRAPVDIDSCQHGAVVFGSHKSKWHWPDVGDPIDDVAHLDSQDPEPGRSLEPNVTQESSSAESTQASPYWKQDSQDTLLTSPAAYRSQSQSELCVPDSSSGRSTDESLPKTRLDPVTAARTTDDLSKAGSKRRASSPPDDDDGLGEDKGGKRRKLFHMAAQAARQATGICFRAERSGREVKDSSQILTDDKFDRE